MPPTIAPMLLAAIASTGSPASSSARSAPTCAIPRAPPPESASASRGRGAGESSGGAAARLRRHGGRGSEAVDREHDGTRVQHVAPLGASSLLGALVPRGPAAFG